MDLDTIKWSSGRKILFRFLFCYFFIYIIIPDSFYSIEFIDSLGQNIFNLDYHVTTLTNGSGDTTFNYIQVFVIFILSLAFSSIWLIIDRKRDNYEKLNYWFRFILRYYLIFTLISYGSCKVIKTQFPFPDLLSLEKKLGDMSPMGLVWTFMGYSVGYNIFAGLGEVIGGLLLVSRRLTTFASIINIAVLSNVFMLNMFYDVPVKIFSFHLLLISIILILDDFVRCFRFFILNTSTEKVEFIKPFKNKRLNWGLNIFKTLIVFYILFISIKNNMDSLDKWGDNRKKPEMYGIYNVEAFKVNNKELPLVLNDKKILSKLIIDIDYTSLVYMTEKSRDYYNLTVNKNEKTMLFQEKNFRYDEEKKGKKSIFTYKELPNNYLLLKGSLNDEKLEIKLKKKDLSKMNFNRGFNWINEYPYNR